MGSLQYQQQLLTLAHSRWRTPPPWPVLNDGAFSTSSQWPPPATCRTTPQDPTAQAPMRTHSLLVGCFRRCVDLHPAAASCASIRLGVAHLGSVQRHRVARAAGGFVRQAAVQVRAHETGFVVAANTRAPKAVWAAASRRLCTSATRRGASLPGSPLLRSPLPQVRKPGPSDTRTYSTRPCGIIQTPPTNLQLLQPPPPADAAVPPPPAQALPPAPAAAASPCPTACSLDSRLCTLQEAGV